jgi:hypothetical protein
MTLNTPYQSQYEPLSVFFPKEGDAEDGVDAREQGGQTSYVPVYCLREKEKGILGNTPTIFCPLLPPFCR